MWDGINTDAATIAKLIGPNDLVAYYIDGHFAWTEEEKALFPNNQHVTITVLGNPADVADCETGDMDPPATARWIRSQRARGYLRPTAYRSLSLMQDLRDSTEELVMGKDWDSWVADYDNQTADVYQGSAAKQFKNTAAYDETVIYDNGWPHRSVPAAPVLVSVTDPRWPAGQVLKIGDRGNAVMALQKALAGTMIHGVRGIAVDGDFGQQTRTALRNFQSNEQLTLDGLAGNQVRGTLVNMGRLNSAGQAA